MPPLSVKSSKAAAASANRIRLSESYGQSGMRNLHRLHPAFSTALSAARSTSVAGALLHPLRKIADTQTLDTGVGVKVEVAGHACQVACIADRKWHAVPAALSSTERVIGPSLSNDQHSVIAPVRGTRP